MFERVRPVSRQSIILGIGQDVFCRAAAAFENWSLSLDAEVAFLGGGINSKKVYVKKFHDLPEAPGGI